MNIGPLTRIAIGAALSAWLTPKILDRFVQIEIEGDPTAEGAAKRNELLRQSQMGITAAITMATFVALGMAGGKSAAAAIKAEEPKL